MSLGSFVYDLSLLELPLGWNVLVWTNLLHNEGEGDWKEKGNRKKGEIAKIGL